MIRAGLIGLGYWGPNLLRNLFDHEKITVNRVCDLNTKKFPELLRRHPQLKVTTDANDLISDPEIDLVVIATPVKTHFELAKKVLRERKHLLVTKPMTHTVWEAVQLVELAERNHSLLMVDHTFVYHPAVDFMKQTIESNRLGKALYFQSQRMNLGLYQPDVSVIYDLMPHDLSILNELIKEDPIEILCYAKNLAQLPQPDLACLQLNYQSNLAASIQATWLSPTKIRDIIIIGEHKMLLYNDTDMMEKVRIYDRGVDYSNPKGLAESYTKFIQYRQGDIFSPALSNAEALKREVCHLVDCLEHKKKPLSDGYEGLRVVRILERAEQVATSQSSWVALRPSSTPPSAATPALGKVSGIFNHRE